MKNILLYLCDPDGAYMHRMDSYIRHREYSPFIVRTYTGIDALAQEDEPPGVLLVNAVFFDEVQSDLGHWLDRERTGVVFLDEGGGGSWTKSEAALGQDVDRIDKYQPAGRIYDHLLEVCAARGDFFIQPEKARGRRGRLIGVYTPENRRLQRDYAWSLARRLSQKERTLYLSLEEFLFGGGHEAGVSDLILTIREIMDKKDRSGDACGSRQPVLAEQLLPRRCICREDGLDMIPPAACPYDLGEIGDEEWYFWLEQVLETGIYDVIVLSFGGAAPGLCLLELCSELYMPAGPEDQEVCRSFKETLSFMGRQSAADRIRSVDCQGQQDQ